MPGFPSIKVTYFPHEGSGEKVRLALAVAGIPFNDERIARADFPKLKPSTKYGQLPMMTINEITQVAQSEAMLRYVGRLGGLYPAEHALIIDEAIGLVGDLLRAWRPAFKFPKEAVDYGHPEHFEKTEEGKAVAKSLREKFVATELPKYLGYFQDILGDHSFLVGDEPTIADCMLVPALQDFTRGTWEHIPVTCLDTHPKVTAYIARFLELPKVKAYYAALKK
jgi:glutathione S-transferase